MDPATIALISQLVGTGVGIGGGLIGPDQQKWQQNALVDVLNRLAEGQSYGRGIANDIFGNLSPQYADLLNRGQLNTFGGGDGSVGLWGEYQGGIQGLLNQIRGQGQQGIDPFTQEQINNQQGLIGQTQPAIDNLLSILSSGGRSFDGGMVRDRLMDIINGQGAQIDQLGASGLNLLSSGGRTNIGNVSQDRGIDVLNQYGRTGETSSALQQALQRLSTGGRTSGLDTLNRVGTEGLNAGGRTFETDQLTKRGLDIAGREALLPLQQVISLAQDEAGRNVRDQFKSVRQRAALRGGGPGSEVRSGLENQEMAEFAPQAAEAEAKALRDALLGQQGLQLQQMGLGSNLAQAGIGAANQRFGQSADILNLGETGATQRENQAFNAIASLLGTETNRAGTFGQLGNSAAAQEVQRLLAGSGMLNDYNQTRLQGSNQLLNLLGMENQNNQSAASLLNTLTNSQQGALGNIIQQALQSKNFGLNESNSSINNLMQALGLQGNQLDRSLNLTTTGLNVGGNLLSQFLNFAQSAQSGYPGVFGGNTGGVAGINWGNVGQGLSGAATALGELFRRTGRTTGTNAGLSE